MLKKILVPIHHDLIFFSPLKVSLAQSADGHIVGCPYDHDMDDDDKENISIHMNEDYKRQIQILENQSNKRLFFVSLHGLILSLAIKTDTENNLGIFMILAWMVLVSTAIYTARYMRNTLRQSVFGMKLWFHVRLYIRILIVLVFYLCLGS